MAKVLFQLNGDRIPMISAIVDEATARKAVEQYMNGREFITLEHEGTVVCYRTKDITLIGFAPWDEEEARKALQAQQAAKAECAQLPMRPVGSLLRPY